ncbi:MAG: GMC oxidoreductase [Acidimicrobiales bacterium]
MPAPELPPALADPVLRAVVAAAADRIVPAGDGWPSATGEDVLGYLDREATSAHAGLWLDVLGPGIAWLESEAWRVRGSGFAALAPEDQDRLLAGDAPRAHALRDALVRVVTEGYYGDAGRDADAGRLSWEMVGYRARQPGSGPGSLPEPAPRIHAIHELEGRYDVVVVGAGAGGGVAAAVLAEAGLAVALLERGEWLGFADIGTDHLRNHRLARYGCNTGPPPAGHPRSLLSTGGDEVVTAPHDAGYHNNASTLGGGTRVYGGQAWRFFPDDFAMATRYGIPAQSSLADWPISYDDLAPYYEKVEWAVGVAGDGAAHASSRGARLRGYPMPAFPPSTEALLLTASARRLGWEVGPPPLLVNTVEHDGRPACERCGRCVGFACPADAKNGTHNTTIRRALRTGRCDLATGVLAERVLCDARGNATGVAIVAADGTRRTLRAGHVVLAAGAVETARLLLASASDKDPDGLGNRSGNVGRHLQGHCYAGAFGLFAEPVRDTLGPGPAVAACGFAHGNPGVVGGGMLANEFVPLPLSYLASGLAPDAPRWGLAGKQAMRVGYRRTLHVMGPTEEVPVASCRVRLSPTVRDRFGLPVAMLSGTIHPETIRTAALLGERAEAWLDEAGAVRTWHTPTGTGLSAGQHQAGTARMGDDPATSVTGPDGRVHGYANLWVADSSVHVTNGAVNPVLTVMALAWRCAETLART